MARLRRFQLGQNPYATPTECHAADRPARRIPMSRGEIARRFAITGFVGGGILGSFGYLALIVVIEILLTPPFSSPANYGQFMVVVVYVAFYMSMFGLCLGLVPYISSLGYIPLHVLGVFSIYFADQQFFTEVGWTEAPIVAMLILLFTPCCVAIAFDCLSRGRIRQIARSRAMVSESRSFRSARQD